MVRSLQSSDLSGFDEIIEHLKKKFRVSINLCLAVDGSRVTEKATNTLTSMMFAMEKGVRPVKPKLSVLHVFDPKKTTPRHLGPERVIEAAKLVLDSRLGPDNGVYYQSSQTDKSKSDKEDDGESDVGGTCDTVMRLNDEFDTDLLVLGGAGVNEKGM